MEQNFSQNFDIMTIWGKPDMGDRKGTFGIHYRGINCVKCPFDWVMYQMILHEVQPDLLIEIGSYQGGSALMFSDLMRMYNPNAMVHTVDIAGAEVLPSHPMVTQNPGIKCFDTGYQGYPLEEAVGFSRIMVIDDGSHLYTDCVSAFDRLNHLVGPDSYYVIEDGMMSINPAWEMQFGGGPWRATLDLLEQNPEWETDRKWCDFFGQNATFNPDGYLRRKR